MGKIFPMAPVVVRNGYVRRLEKERQRAAEAQIRLTALLVEPARLLVEAPPKPAPTGLQRYNERRSREARRKAEARRLSGDLAISGAVKNLLAAVWESVEMIARSPRDGKGRVLIRDASCDGHPRDHFIKPSWKFARFTVEERNALSATIRKHRAAAARLSASIDEARGRWLATYEGYRNAEGREL